MKETGLEVYNYPYMADVLYKGQLGNGLAVYFLPKTDFVETYGLLSVAVGAKDWLLTDKQGIVEREFPFGLAHFLEHKVFEMKDGADALQLFSSLGASANAYTGLCQTNYLFSTTEKVEQSVALLQEMVHQLIVSDSSVEKEKDIILQEVKMYRDDPDDRLYVGILGSLYPDTALAEDIVGSLDSVGKIMVSDLQDYFKAFYHPSQMSLFVVGNIEVESLWEQVLATQKVCQFEPFVNKKQTLPHHPILPHRTSRMSVSSPKLAVGVRGNMAEQIGNLTLYKCCLSLLFSMLVGWTSKTYQDLYETGKIDSSFSTHLEVQQDFQFFVVTTDTTEPIAVSTKIQKTIRDFEKNSDISQDNLDLVKKEMYGDVIRSLNSIEAIASLFASDTTKESTFLDLPALIEKIRLEDVIAAGRTFIGQSDLTDFIIFPN